MVTVHERLDPRACERVKGSAWDGIRSQFLELSKILLDVAPSTVSELTTIYVKYLPMRNAEAKPFAVVWLKNSKQMTVGLALPISAQSHGVGPPPLGMSYAGLTGYVTISAGESLPDELSELARLAFIHSSGCG